MLLLPIVSRKGITGVLQASLVVAAATLPMFDVPSAGMVLLIGIDQFLDMSRIMMNAIGNGVATAAVAKWEGELSEGPAAPEPAKLPVAA